MVNIRLIMILVGVCLRMQLCDACSVGILELGHYGVEIRTNKVGRCYQAANQWLFCCESRK